MIKLIDNTLTTLDRNLPSKEELHLFAELLFKIGVDAVELSVKAFEQMGFLPENRKFILDIDFIDDIKQYPGFYRYVSRHEASFDEMIYELQLNDIREILRLRALRNCKEIRIVGLDDLICNDSYEKIFGEIKQILPRSMINFCPENTYHCASALAVQWAAEFGGDITTSFAGCKNNAATEEVIMAMRLSVRYKVNRDLTILPQLTRLYEKITGKPIGNKKAIIGKNIFKVEAGIHADGMKKNPATYEAYDPRIVGGRTQLVIGKHSGTKAVIYKLEELGLPALNDSFIDLILTNVKEICMTNNKSLSDTEFINMVKEVSRYEKRKIYC